MRKTAIALLLMLPACQSLSALMPSETHIWPDNGLPSDFATLPLNTPTSFTQGGAPATITVTSEYRSASGTTCRAYRMDDKDLLACASGSDWQPVRKLP